MQQTETYQLNLIDPSDDFSPEPLNANARAIETKLSAVETNLGSTGATARILSGTVKGTGSEVSLNFEKFKPMVVFLGLKNSEPHIFLRDCTASYNNSAKVTWTDTGFSFTGSELSGVLGGAPLYVAIGVSL